MGGINTCETCHWISRDGRCFNNDSPHGRNRDQMSANDRCSQYEMDPGLRRAMEQQERDRREREERERKEKEHQEWLKTDDGKKWQAEENRKKEEERLEKERIERIEREEREERERKEREEKERKEREHQEWLKTDEGQKWQEEQIRQREKERKKREMHERLWKIGRIAAPSFTILSIIMLFVSNGVSEDKGSIGTVIFLGIFFIIPFAVIYFCEGIIKRIIFFITGIGLSIFLLYIASQYPNDAETIFFIIMSISYIISCVLAMVYKKDEY